VHALWSNASNVHSLTPPPPWSACARTGPMPSMCECSHSALEQCHQCANAVTPHWNNATNVRVQSLRTGAMPSMCECSHSALEQCHQCARAVTPHWSNAINVCVQSLRTGAMPSMCECSHSALEQCHQCARAVTPHWSRAMPPMCACSHSALEQCHQCARAVTPHWSRAMPSMCACSHSHWSNAINVNVQSVQSLSHQNYPSGPCNAHRPRNIKAHLRNTHTHIGSHHSDHPLPFTCPPAERLRHAS